jgi:hypothetical protein
MLSEANASFVNGAVTIVRWFVYITLAMLAIGAAWSALAWLWEQIRPVTDKSELEKARRHMRDLGY